MPKPRNAIRPIEKRINLDENICTELDLLLMCKLEGKVPHGAYSKYIKRLIAEDKAKNFEILLKVNAGF